MEEKTINHEQEAQEQAIQVEVPEIEVEEVPAEEVSAEEVTEEDARMAKEIKDAEQAADFYDSLSKVLDDLFDSSDSLEELHAVRRLGKLLEDRDKQIVDDALTQALAILNAEKPSRDNGAFEHNGKQFEVSVKEVYDFVGHWQSYTMPEGVEYREKARQKKQLSRESKTLTTDMSNILSKFKLTYPDKTPDWTELTLKCK